MACVASVGALWPLPLCATPAEPARTEPAPSEATKTEATKTEPAPSEVRTTTRPFAYAEQLPSPLDDAEFLPDCDWLCFAHLYGEATLGRGLRFNNPYRLRTQLGDEAESLSLTALYGDIAFALLLGDPHGFQQGARLALSSAVFGVRQQVLSPAYAVAYRLGHRVELRGHAGLPVVLQPDANLGLDLAAGAAFWFLAGVGVTGSLVFSLYEGAGTDQRAATLIPVLSAQLGLTIDYEVLP